MEEKFTKIFHEFHAFLKIKTGMGRQGNQGSRGYNQSGQIIVIQDIENHLYREKNKDYYYFNMRLNN